MDRRVLVAGVGAIVLALAGCGSSSKPMTKAEFTRKAHAICAHRQAFYAKTIFARAAPRTRDELQRRIRAALPEIESSVDRLAALRPPDGLKAAYAEIMTVERRHAAQAQSAARTGRLVTQEDGPVLHRREGLRVRLGMADCD
jgi:hypothetical protein